MTKRASVTVGDRVRAKRLALKLSQYEVAKLAGIRPETMSKLETGKNAASLVTLHKVAPILGTTIDELLNDETTAPKPPKKTKGKQV